MACRLWQWWSSLAAGRDRFALFRERDQRLVPAEDLVDDPVVLGLLRGQEVVALGVALHPFGRLAGVPRQDGVQLLHERAELAHLDEDVGRIAAEPTRGLVEDDPFAQQAAEDVVSALAPAGLLDHDGDVLVPHLDRLHLFSRTARAFERLYTGANARKGEGVTRERAY